MTSNPLLGIALKLISTVAFAGMIVALKLVGDRVPPGEAVFFRSFFALVPVVAYIWWRGELRTGLQTDRPLGHIVRSFYGVSSMFLWFTSLQLLPIADALAISYAAPLLTVALAGLLLGERVRIFRWTAVGAGFSGVLVMLAPHFGDLSHLMQDTAAIGAMAALVSTVFSALAGIQVRRLTQTERTGAIVVYFSVGSTLIALLTLPFGWIWPVGLDLWCLIGSGLFGGVGQILLTLSYRNADASTVAPLEYASMLWAIAYGAWLFGEVPGAAVLVGSTIVVAAGLFIILRERALGYPAEAVRRPEPPTGS